MESMGLGVFVESVKRLYESGIVSGEKILEWFKDGKITEKEKNYILNAH